MADTTNSFGYDTTDLRHQAEVDVLLNYLYERNCASSVGLIAYGGSTAYGLDTEASDVDLRGFFLPTARDLMLFHDEDTVNINEEVDGVLYSANKLTSLLLACNPNVIEILGIAPEHILIGSPFYNDIRANKDIYLSRRAADTFGGYATQQLRRIENSMSRDKGDTDTEGALRSMRSAIKSFDEKYTAYSAGALNVHLEENTEVGAKALLIDMDMKGVPITELRSMCGDLDAIAKNADNLAARNRKKKTEKLSKHMSHLIRLLRMGTELLETGEVNTYRTGEDAQLLLNIKQGMWMEEDENGVRHVDDAFWDLLAQEKARFEEAEKNTSLPEQPDRDRATELLLDMHYDVLLSVGVGSSMA